ncbi:hypothetical protein H5410_052852 [Solanum commersonii]|uniref:Uncharacterized protein n=1 Tax=Solanum commersonii TaxID=4109 RepID=A0A9J5X1Y7_SOLCO|nr:hypothetical protein H5410_052852 [Solanum commersonii]
MTTHELAVNQVDNMQGLVDNLGCKVASLPTKYLGMPLGAKNKELEPATDTTICTYLEPRGWDLMFGRALNDQEVERVAGLLHALN